MATNHRHCNGSSGIFNFQLIGNRYLCGKLKKDMAQKTVTMSNAVYKRFLAYKEADKIARKKEGNIKQEANKSKCDTKRMKQSGQR
jgi:hypothetical protein